MAYRICVDVGGTFTDLASVDENQIIRISKSPTTPRDYPQGIENCIDLLSEDIKTPASVILQQCTNFIHGSTIITNAVVEGKVARVGFIVTHGFRDILSIREGSKEDCYNLYEDYPGPYVPRHLTVPVNERINSEGGIETPLDEEGVKQALKVLIEHKKVDAVAVCLLWSIANPVHEIKIKEIAAGNWPGTTCILSHETNPIIREYRRASSTVIEASIRHKAREYMRNVDTRLKKKGFKGSFYMVTSSGSVLGADEAGERGISLIGSGPAMAPVGAKWYSAMEGDENGNLIVTDMGGTSFDVSLVSDWEVARTRETKVGNELLGINSIDSRSIGSGGGSIAWIDSGGMIHLGPESAGAIPGPACYRLGGQKATVTDANLILGYINPDYFLGGRMKIDYDLAKQAIIKNVAQPLNLTIEEAAFTIWSTVNVDMVSAIQDLTIWQGIDPREFLIVAGGGAANCHAVALARDLSVQKLLLPKYGGVMSAVGGLVADICADFSCSYFTSTNNFNFSRVNEALSNLEDEARLFLSKLGASQNNSMIEFFTEARYTFQVWDLSIPLKSSRISNDEDLQQLREAFDSEHEKIFSIKDSGQSIECVHWSARATFKMPEVKLKEMRFGGEDPSEALMPKRKAYFKEVGGMVPTQIYRGDKLSYGNLLPGPAIIEEPTSSIVIPPGAKATVTKWGNYFIEIDI